MDRTKSSGRIDWITYLAYLAVCLLLLGTM